jgi:hypothetical protein
MPVFMEGDGALGRSSCWNCQSLETFIIAWRAQPAWALSTEESGSRNANALCWELSEAVGPSALAVVLWAVKRLWVILVLLCCLSDLLYRPGWKVIKPLCWETRLWRPGPDTQEEVSSDIHFIRLTSWKYRNVKYVITGESYGLYMARGIVRIMRLGRLQHGTQRRKEEMYT